MIGRKISLEKFDLFAIFLNDLYFLFLLFYVKSMRYTIVLMQNICFPKMYVTMCACSSNNHVLIIINKKRTSKGFVMKN